MSELVAPGPSSLEQTTVLPHFRERCLVATRVEHVAAAQPTLDRWGIRDASLIKMIRWKASLLVDKWDGVFSVTDCEDIEQEFRIHLSKRSKSYDPSRASYWTFVNTVFDNFGIDLVRRRTAKKRDDRRIASFSCPIGEPDGTEILLGDVVGQREQDSYTARRTRTGVELWQMVEDVTAVVQGLPPDLRELANRLKFHSIAEVARQTGVPRTTLNSRVRRIRKVFEKEELGSYQTPRQLIPRLRTRPPIGDRPAENEAGSARNAA